MFPWKTGLGVCLFGVDEILKQRVEDQLEEDEIRSYLDDRLLIRKVYNRGFIFSSLEDKNTLVKGVSIVAGTMVFLMDLWTERYGNLQQKLGMTLLSAGAASNIFDRLIRGKVIDYIAVRTKNSRLKKITANLGDIYIALGAVLIWITKIGKR